VIVVGVLIDTFVVRSLFVPAVLSLAADLNWWPVVMPDAHMPDGEEYDQLVGEVTSRSTQGSRSSRSEIELEVTSQNTQDGRSSRSELVYREVTM